MGSQSKIQHAQYLTGDYGIADRSLNFASSLQRGKRIQMRKGAATIARRNAFLDLQQATAHANAHHKRRHLAKAMGRKLDPSDRPADVELYLERYRLAVEEQKRVKGGN